MLQTSHQPCHTDEKESEFNCAMGVKKKKKKLFGVRIDLEPDGRSWNRWCPGCLVSFMMFLALHSQQVPVKMMSAQCQRCPVLSVQHAGGHVSASFGEAAVCGAFVHVDDHLPAQDGST